MRFKLVVFDMAGTTVEEGGAVYQCLQATLASAGVWVSENALHEIKGMDKREALRLLVEREAPSSALLDQIGEVHQDFVSRMIDFYRRDASVRETPGASELFRWLRGEGVKVGLDTGFSREIAQILIDRFEWETHGLIDASVASDEVPRGRPHPDMIRTLMERLDVQDPGAIVKIGDAPADLLEGKNAGCGLVIGVTQGSSAREELARYPHDYLLGTIAELPQLLVTL